MWSIVRNNVSTLHNQQSIAIDQISGKSDMAADISSDIAVEDTRNEILREEEALYTLIGSAAHGTEAPSCFRHIDKPGA